MRTRHDTKVVLGLLASVWAEFVRRERPADVLDGVECLIVPRDVAHDLPLLGSRLASRGHQVEDIEDGEGPVEGVWLEWLLLRLVLLLLGMLPAARRGLLLAIGRAADSALAMIESESGERLQEFLQFPA